MSKATRLIKKLDAALNEQKTFGDLPDSFIDTLINDLQKDMDSLVNKSKPEHWAEIYVERDRARIKQAVLNHLMDRGSE